LRWTLLFIPALFRAAMNPQLSNGKLFGRLHQRRRTIAQRSGPNRKADFISKIGTTEEEADETLFWLECLAELATREHVELTRLLKECDELVAILTSSRKTANRR